jgi:hypothetical protein
MVTSSQVIRRARIFAMVTLLIAGFVGAPLIEVVPKVRSVPDALIALLFVVPFALAGAAGGIAATLVRDRDRVAGRALAAGAIVAALPPVIAGIWDASLMKALAALLTAGWGAALAAPSIPLASAVVETKESPSLDALDQVIAMAGGFVFAVKTPEAVVSGLLGERGSALVCGAMALAGALVFGLIQLRRRARATRVRDQLADEEVELVDEHEPDGRAPMLSGSGRVVAVQRRDGAAYREGTRVEILGVVAREPVWPAPREDAVRVLKCLALASFLGLVAYGVAILGMST